MNIPILLVKFLIQRKNLINRLGHCFTNSIGHFLGPSTEAKSEKCLRQVTKVNIRSLFQIRISLQTTCRPSPSVFGIRHQDFRGGTGSVLCRSGTHPRNKRSCVWIGASNFLIFVEYISKTIETRTYFLRWQE